MTCLGEPYDAIKFLIESGANLNLTDDTGKDTLMTACMTISLVSNNRIRKLTRHVQLLAISGVDISASTIYLCGAETGRKTNLPTFLTEYRVINWNRKVISSGFI
jgi:ankyrin repeat protein